MPHLSKLIIYPIKSLDGVEVEQATVLASGALQQDRELAICDLQGKFVNGKRTAKIHALRSQFDLAARTVTLQIQGQDSTSSFHLDRDRPALSTWFSDYFGFPVQVQQNTVMGFPDDTDSPGPTVISTATLDAIASWFPGLDSQQIRLRLRSNIEIGGVPAFWEDQLFTTTDQVVPFQIGKVYFQGINPCQRCVVPSRDPLTGEVYPNFQKLFVHKRQETLPTWAEKSRFNHFFRLAINTRISTAESGKVLQVGDSVNLITSSALESGLVS